MKTLVVYTSRETGNTRKVASAIAAALGPDCALAAASEAPSPDGFDFIALGFGVYRGWPDGDLRAYMKRCRDKDVGIFMTLGAWPDSSHAHTCLGRAEGLLDNCRTRVKFICQGGYTPAYLERLKSLPADSAHGWNAERAARVTEAMKHPDQTDLDRAAALFSEAVRQLEAASAKSPRPPKPAQVLAVFGSTVPRAAVAYDRIEAAMRNSRPQEPVFRAYTSAAVRGKLTGVEAVPSLPGVLQQLVQDGYTEAHIVAGFLTPGEEFHKMRRDATAFARELAITISRPALSDLETLRAFLAAVKQTVPAERTTGEDVIFMGHGNADGRSDFQYMAAEAVLRETDPKFHIACVEGNPAFDTVRKRVTSRRVWLLPLMVVAGDHALNDMAGDNADSWRSRLTAAGHQVECVLQGLGEHAAVAAWFAQSDRSES